MCSLLSHFRKYIESLSHLPKLGGDCFFQQSKKILSLATKVVKARTLRAILVTQHDCGTAPNMAHRGLGDVASPKISFL